MKEVDEFVDLGVFTEQEAGKGNKLYSGWFQVPCCSRTLHPCCTTDVFPMAEPVFCRSESVPLSYAPRELSCQLFATLLLDSCPKSSWQGIVQKIIVYD